MTSREIELLRACAARLRSCGDEVAAAQLEDAARRAERDATRAHPDGKHQGIVRLRCEDDQPRPGPPRGS